MKKILLLSSVLALTCNGLIAHAEDKVVKSSSTSSVKVDNSHHKDAKNNGSVKNITTPSKELSKKDIDKLLPPTPSPAPSATPASVQKSPDIKAAPVGVVDKTPLPSPIKVDMGVKNTTDVPKPAPLDFKDAGSYDVWLKVVSTHIDEDYHLMNLKTNGKSPISMTTEHSYPSNVVNIVTSDDSHRYEEQKTIISHYLTGFMGGIQFSQPSELCSSINKKGATSLMNAIPKLGCDAESTDGKVHVSINLAYHYVSGVTERDSDVSPVDGKILKYQLPDESRIALQEDFSIPESGGIEIYNGTTQGEPLHIYMMIIPHK